VTVTLGELNTLSRDRAAELFTACCGASRWVSAMVMRRPYANVDEMLNVADDVWRDLEPADWLEAFAHHPRIGEQESAAPRGNIATVWSASEQAGVSMTQDRARLAAINEEYEQRFGFIYIVCAAGRSADELMSIGQARLRNDANLELRIAANEQRKITALRLRKLITGLQ
jgi:OHCU decarboxylase